MRCLFITPIAPDMNAHQKLVFYGTLCVYQVCHRRQSGVLGASLVLHGFLFWRFYLGQQIALDKHDENARQKYVFYGTNLSQAATQKKIKTWFSISVIA